MTEEKKKQLFPYFAYLYSQQLNPEKYGNAESIEEWTSLIQESPEDIEEITNAASGLSDDDWAEIEAQYNEEQSSDEVEMAKKGAKLKKLQALKKSPKAKKCACGCDLVTFKEKGGKLSTKCSCNCKGGKVSKKEDGGILKYQNPIAGLAYQQSQYNEKKAAHADKYKTKKVSKPQKDKTITVEKAPYTKARVLPEVIVRPQTKTTVNPTSGTAKTQTSGGVGGTSQRVTTQNNKLPSTSGAVKIPSGNNAKRVPAQSDRLTSIVDYLNADGVNSSFANRKGLAQEMGIRNYVGSAQQNTQLINSLRQKKDRELTSARMEIPSIAQLAPAVASIPTPSLSKTLLASNRKGGLIKKAQKGTKTKGEYIGNHESWNPKTIGTGDNSMNPKDWSPEKKKADREAWLNRNKKVTTKPIPSKKEVELPKRNK